VIASNFRQGQGEETRQSSNFVNLFFTLLADQWRCERWGVDWVIEREKNLSKDALPLSGFRILIAEDETLIALYLQRVLSSAGAEVETVGQVAQVFRATKSPPDLALLDVSLTDGEVFPAATALQSAGVPLIFHSGHASNIDRLTEFPQSLALEKPAHRSEILDAVFSKLFTNPERMMA
jgi:CheY-like chemotaxis protein